MTLWATIARLAQLVPVFIRFRLIWHEEAMEAVAKIMIIGLTCSATRMGGSADIPNYHSTKILVQY